MRGRSSTNRAGGFYPSGWGFESLRPFHKFILTNAWWDMIEKKRCHKCKALIAELEVKNKELRGQNEDLKDRVYSMTQTIDELEQKVSDLSSQVLDLSSEVTCLYQQGDFHWA